MTSSFTQTYINQLKRFGIVTVGCKLQAGEIEGLTTNSSLVIENPNFLDPVVIVVRDRQELINLFTVGGFAGPGGARILLPAGNFTNLPPDLISIGDNIIIEGSGEATILEFLTQSSSYYLRAVGPDSGFKNLRITRGPGLTGPLILLDGIRSFLIDCVIFENSLDTSVEVDLGAQESVIEGNFLTGPSSTTPTSNGIFINEEDDLSTITNNTIRNYRNGIWSGISSETLVRSNSVICENFISECSIFFLSNGLENWNINGNSFVNIVTPNSSVGFLLGTANNTNISDNNFVNLQAGFTTAVTFQDNTNPVGLPFNVIFEGNHFNDHNLVTTGTSDPNVQLKDNFIGIIKDPQPLIGLNGNASGNFAIETNFLITSNNISAFQNNRINVSRSLGLADSNPITLNNIVDNYSFTVADQPFTFIVPDLEADNSGKVLTITIEVSNVGSDPTTIAPTSPNGFTFIQVVSPNTGTVVLVWNGASWTLVNASQGLILVP